MTQQRSQVTGHGVEIYQQYSNVFFAEGGVRLHLGVRLLFTASARAGLLADRDLRSPSGAWTGLHPDGGGAGRDGEPAPSDDLQGTLEEEAAAPGGAPAHVLRERRLALVNRVEAN